MRLASTNFRFGRKLAFVEFWTGRKSVAASSGKVPSSIDLLVGWQQEKENLENLLETSYDSRCWELISGR